MTVEISYQGTLYYAEGEYDEVRRLIEDGKPLDVYRWERGSCKRNLRITFYQDVDYVAVEL